MKFSRIYIDVSNLYHRAFATSSHLTFTLPDGTPIVTGGVFTSLKMISRLMDEYLSENGLMYFLFDYTHSEVDKKGSSKEEVESENIRKHIDPEYKANRTDRPDEKVFFYGLNILHLILMNYRSNFVVVKIPGYEADDLVKPLLEEVEDEYEQVLLVSKDLDWARGFSLAKNVYWLNGDKVYDPDLFEEEYGFFPTCESLTLYKAFRGDDSDHIPKGVPGIREKVLVKLVEEFDSVDEIISKIEKISYLGENWKNKIIENKNRIKLNYRLVDYLPLKRETVQEYAISCEYNPKVLRNLYHSLGFKISRVDMRLLKEFPSDDNSKENFFIAERVERV